MPCQWMCRGYLSCLSNCNVFIALCKEPPLWFWSSILGLFQLFCNHEIFCFILVVLVQQVNIPVVQFAGDHKPWKRKVVYLALFCLLARNTRLGYLAQRLFFCHCSFQNKIPLHRFTLPFVFFPPPLPLRKCLTSAHWKCLQKTSVWNAHKGIANFVKRRFRFPKRQGRFSFLNKRFHTLWMHYQIKSK